MSQVDLGARLNLDSAPLEQGVQNVINVFRQLQNQLSSISVTDTIKGDPFSAQLKFAENFLKKMNEALTNVEKLDLTGSLKQSVDAIRKSMEEVTKAGGNPIKKLGDLLVTAQEQFGTFATSINNKQIPLTNLEDAREKITKIFTSISKEKLSTEQIQAYSDQVNKIIDGLASEFPQLAAPIQTVREKLNGLFKDLTSQKAPANFLGDYKVKFENALQEMAAIRVKIDPLAEAEVKINEVINGIKKKTIPTTNLQEYINTIKVIFDDLASLDPKLQEPLNKAKGKLDTFYASIKTKSISTKQIEEFKDIVLSSYTEISKAKVDFTPLREAEKRFEEAFDKLSKSGTTKGKFKVTAINEFADAVNRIITDTSAKFPGLELTVSNGLENTWNLIKKFTDKKIPLTSLDQFKIAFQKDIKELENITIAPDPLIKLQYIINELYSSLENKTLSTDTFNRYVAEARKSLELLKKTEASLAEPIAKVEPVINKFFEEIGNRAAQLKTGELIRIDITRGLKAIETAKVDLKPFKEAEEAINKIFTSIGKKKLPVDTFKEYQNQVLAVFDKLANSDTSLKIPLEKAKADLNTFFSSISGKEISVKQLELFKEKVKTIFGEIKNYNVNLEPLRNAEKEISAIFTKINSKELKVKGFTGVKVEIENVIDQLQKAAPQLSEPIAAAKDKLNKLLETFSKKKISTQNLEEFQTEVRKIFEGVSNEKIRLDPLYIAKENINRIFTEISKKEINADTVNKYVLQVKQSLDSLKQQFPSLSQPIEAVNNKITDLLENIGTKKIPIKSAQDYKAQISTVLGEIVTAIDLQMKAGVGNVEGLFGELSQYINSFSLEGAVKGNPLSTQVQNVLDFQKKLEEIVAKIEASGSVEGLSKQVAAFKSKISAAAKESVKPFEELKESMTSSKEAFSKLIASISTKEISVGNFEKAQKRLEQIFNNISKGKISEKNINEYSKQVDSVVEGIKKKFPTISEPIEKVRGKLHELLNELTSQKAPSNLLGDYKSKLEAAFAEISKTKVQINPLVDAEKEITSVFNRIKGKKLPIDPLQKYVDSIKEIFTNLETIDPKLQKPVSTATAALDKFVKEIAGKKVPTTTVEEFRTKVLEIYQQLSKTKISIDPLKDAQVTISNLFKKIESKTIDPKGIETYVQSVKDQFERIKEVSPSLEVPLANAERILNRLVKSISTGEISATPLENFKTTVEKIFADLGKAKLDIQPVKKAKDEINKIFAQISKPQISVNEFKTVVGQISSWLETLKKQEAGLEGPIKKAQEKIEAFKTKVEGTPYTPVKLEEFKKEVLGQFKEIESYKLNLNPFKNAEKALDEVFNKINKKTLTKKGFEEFEKEFFKVISSLSKNTPQLTEPVKKVKEEFEKLLAGIKGKKISIEAIEEFKAKASAKLKELETLQISLSPLEKAKTEILSILSQIEKKPVEPAALKTYEAKVVAILENLKKQESTLAAPLDKAVKDIELSFKELASQKVSPKFAEDLSKKITGILSTLSKTKMDISPFQEAQVEINKIFDELLDKKLPTKTIEEYAKEFNIVFDNLKEKVGELPEGFKTLQDHIEQTIQSFQGKTISTEAFNKLRKEALQITKSLASSANADMQSLAESVRKQFEEAFQGVQTAGSELNFEKWKSNFNGLVEYIKNTVISTGEVQIQLSEAKQRIDEFKKYIMSQNIENAVKGDPYKRQHSYILEIKKRIATTAKEFSKIAADNSLNLNSILGLDSLDTSVFMKPLEAVEEALIKFKEYAEGEENVTQLLELGTKIITQKMDAVEALAEVEAVSSERTSEGYRLAVDYIQKVVAAYRVLYEEGRKQLLQVEELNAQQKRYLGIKVAGDRAAEIRKEQVAQQQLVEKMKLGIDPLKTEEALRKSIIDLALKGVKPDQESISTLTQIANRVLQIRTEYEILDRVKKSALASGTSGGLLLAQEVEKEQQLLVGAATKTKKEYESLTMTQREAVAANMGYGRTLTQLVTDMKVTGEQLKILKNIEQEFFATSREGSKALQEDIIKITQQQIKNFEETGQRLKKQVVGGPGYDQLVTDLAVRQQKALADTAKEQADKYSEQAGTVASLTEQYNRLAMVREILSKKSGAEAEAALNLVYADQAKVVANLAQFQELKTKEDMEQYMSAKYNIQSTSQLSASLKELQREEARLSKGELKNLFNKDTEAANEYTETVINLKQKIIDLKRVQAELYGQKSMDFETLDDQEKALVAERNRVKIAKESVSTRRKLIETLDLETRHLDGMNLKLHSIGKIELQNAAVAERIKNMHKALTDAQGKNVQLSAEQLQVLRVIEPLMKKIKAIESNQAGLFNLDFKRMAWFAQLRAYWMFYQVVTSAAQASVEFERNVAKVAAISGATTPQIDLLRESLMRLGPETTFKTSELAEGLVTIAQAGYNAAEAIKMIEATAHLATGTMSDMNTSANIMTTVMKAWNYEASKASEVADRLTAAINISKITMDGLVTSFNYVTGIAPQINMSLEETLALLAQLANAGINASISATSIRAMFAELMTPNERLISTLQSVGLTMADVDPQLHSVSTVLKTLNKAGFDVTKAFEGMERRAASGVSVLVRYADSYDDVVNRITQVGLAQEAASKATDNIATQWDQFTTLLSTSFSKAIENTTELIKLLIIGLKEAVKVIGVTFNLISSVVAPIGSVILKLMDLTSYTKKLISKEDNERMKKFKEELTNIGQALDKTTTDLIRMTQGYEAYNKVLQQANTLSSGKTVSEELYEQAKAGIEALKIAEKSGIVATDELKAKEKLLETTWELLQANKDNIEIQKQNLPILKSLNEDLLITVKKVTEEYQAQISVLQDLEIGQRRLQQQKAVEVNAESIKETLELFDRVSGFIEAGKFRKSNEVFLSSAKTGTQLEALVKQTEIYKLLKKSWADEAEKDVFFDALSRATGKRADFLEEQLNKATALANTYSYRVNALTRIFETGSDEIDKLAEASGPRSKSIIAKIKDALEAGKGADTTQLIQSLAAAEILEGGAALLNQNFKRYENSFIAETDYAFKLQTDKISKAHADSMQKIVANINGITGPSFNTISEDTTKAYKKLQTDLAKGVSKETSDAFESMNKIILSKLNNITYGLEFESKKNFYIDVFTQLLGNPQDAKRRVETLLAQASSDVDAALKVYKSTVDRAADAALDMRNMESFKGKEGYEKAITDSRNRFKNYLNNLTTDTERAFNLTKQRSGSIVQPAAVRAAYDGLKVVGNAIKETFAEAKDANSAAELLVASLNGLKKAGVDMEILPSQQMAAFAQAIADGSINIEVFMEALKIGKEHTEKISSLLLKTEKLKKSSKEHLIITDAEVANAWQLNEVLKIKTKLEEATRISSKGDITSLQEKINLEYKLVDAMKVKLKTSDAAIRSMIGTNTKYAEAVEKLSDIAEFGESDLLVKKLTKTYGLQEELARKIAKELKDQANIKEDILKNTESILKDEMMLFEYYQGIQDNFKNSMIQADLQKRIIDNEVTLMQSQAKYAEKVYLTTRETVDQLKEEVTYSQKKIELLKEDIALNEKKKTGVGESTVDFLNNYVKEGENVNKENERMLSYFEELKVQVNTFNEDIRNMDPKGLEQFGDRLVEIKDRTIKALDETRAGLQESIQTASPKDRIVIEDKIKDIDQERQAVLQNTAVIQELMQSKQAKYLEITKEINSAGQEIITITQKVATNQEEAKRYATDFATAWEYATDIWGKTNKYSTYLADNLRQMVEYIQGIPALLSEAFGQAAADWAMMTIFGEDTDRMKELKDRYKELGEEKKKAAAVNDKVAVEKLNREMERTSDLMRQEKSLLTQLAVAWKSFADTVIRSLMEMMAKMVAWKALETIGMTALFAGTGGVTPNMEQMVKFGKGGVTSFKSFAGGGMTTSPTLALLGDNPSKKELIIPSENIQKNNVSGYVKEKDSGQPYQITIVNTLSPEDIAGAVAQEAGQKVIINTIGKDILKQGPTFKVIKEAGRR